MEGVFFDNDSCKIYVPDWTSLFNKLLIFFSIEVDYILRIIEGEIVGWVNTAQFFSLLSYRCAEFLIILRFKLVFLALSINS